jgi:hypothetical protein
VRTLVICFLISFIGMVGTIDAIGFWMVYGPYPKPAVICKVCHCGKTVCSRECSEENMCAVKCELDCKRKAQ